MASHSDMVRRRKASADRNRRRNSLPDLSKRNDRDRRINPRDTDTSRDDSDIDFRRNPRPERRTPPPGDDRRRDRDDNDAAPVVAADRPRSRSASLAGQQRRRENAENTGRPRTLSQELRRDDGRDFDSGTELAALRQREANANVVKALVGLEKNLDARAVRELYDTGASSDDIRAMLQKEPDANRVTELINLNASGDPRQIRELLDRNVPYDQLKSMLREESDASRLIGVLDLATGSQRMASVTRLLTESKVGTDQLQRLLRLKPNADNLLTLLRMESGGRVDALEQLFNARIRTKDIHDMLLLNNDAREIVRLTTNRHPKLTARDFLYVSMTDGKAGSMYFKDARIRLVHSGGPKPSTRYDAIRRFKISRAEMDAFDEWESWVEASPRQALSYFQRQARTAEEITDNPRRAPRNREDGTALMEFLYIGGSLYTTHPSRGGAVRIDHNMQQYHVNMLYNLTNDSAERINRYEGQIQTNYDLAERNRRALRAPVRDLRLKQRQRTGLLRNRQQTQADVNNQQLEVNRLLAIRNGKDTERQNRQAAYDGKQSMWNRRKLNTANTAYNTADSQYREAQRELARLQGLLVQLNTTLTDFDNNEMTNAQQAYQRAENDYNTSVNAYENAKTAYRTAIQEENTKLHRWMKGVDATSVIPVRSEA